jgi:hypothetical protein
MMSFIDAGPGWLGVALANRLALIVQFLGARQRDRDLGDAIFEVQLQRHQRQAFRGRAADQFADFAFVEQQLAGARGRRVVVTARTVGRNAEAFDPQLAIAHVGVRFTQTRPAVPQRLDLRALEHEARLPRFQEVVVVPRARVAGYGDLVQGVTRR